jgi:hypothetical protein
MHITGMMRFTKWSPELKIKKSYQTFTGQITSGNFNQFLQE